MGEPDALSTAGQLYAMNIVLHKAEGHNPKDRQSHEGLASAQWQNWQPERCQTWEDAMPGERVR